MTVKAENVVIIGAGLVGTLMAMLLAQRGVRQVTILERQPEQLGEGAGNGRSFNLTVSKRGEAALAQAGILETVLDKTLPITGRMCHMPGEADRRFLYGDRKKHVLHGVRRSDMNTVLLSEAKKHDNIDIRFNVDVLSLCKNTGQIEARDASSQEPLVLPDADFIIGADGAFSTVRKCLLDGERFDYSQEFLRWGYREVKIPPGPAGKPMLDQESLHVWPRGDVMMFALPNPDGSFTGNFIYPLHREVELHTDGFMTEFFRREFPDVAPLVPKIEDSLRALPASNFQTIRTEKWYHGSKVVLLGDSAHGIIPFYGQGMNSGFDDCLTLLRCLETCGADYEQAFAQYQAERKKSTDIIADLSIANFEELRNGFRSPVAQARRRTNNLLFTLFPRYWRPLHILISHTEMSYFDAMSHCRRRDKIARIFGFDLLVLSILLLSRGKDVTDLLTKKLRSQRAQNRKARATGA